MQCRLQNSVSYSLHCFHKHKEREYILGAVVITINACVARMPQVCMCMYTCVSVNCIEVICCELCVSCSFWWIMCPQLSTYASERIVRL